MAKSKQGTRRAKDNEVGKLIRQHSAAAMEIAQANCELKQQGLSDKRKAELGEGIAALQKYMEDTYELIVSANSGKFTKV